VVFDNTLETRLGFFSYLFDRAFGFIAVGRVEHPGLAVGFLEGFAAFECRDHRVIAVDASFTGGDAAEGQVELGLPPRAA